MKNDTAPSDRIVITAIGLTTSLGLDTARSLAAIRGVVANFSEHETVMVNGDAYGTELSGAKIARLPENTLSRQICGTHRAAALLKPALEDCLLGLPETLLSNIRLRWSTRAEMINDDFPAALQSLLENWQGFELLQTEPVVAGLGRCQFFEDVIEAMADLRAGTCQGVLVACVDSLCDTPHLEQLFEEGRLKSGSDPEGIVAGEGAGAFLLELESRAKARNAPVYAYLHAGGKGFESTGDRGSAPANGKELSKAFREAFSQLSGGGTEIDMVLVDLNGEGARAYEWGCTEGRVFSSRDTPPDLKHPADCAGDCGMAMGAVLLGAAAGFMSGTLPVRHVALSTADEKGARRVLCLEKGPSLIQQTKAFRNRNNPPAPFPMVIDQHYDEAAFLWQARRHLTTAPHFSLQDLARHDDRFEAHLEGLRLAGETGWELCQRNLERQWAEEFFAPALLAFESGKKSRIRKVVKAASSDREAARALVSALGWMPYDKAEPHLRRFFDSECSFDRYLGIAAGALHRQIPAPVLNRAVLDPDPLVKERAWKAVGELGRGKDFAWDLMFTTGKTGQEDWPFYATWSAALADNPYAVNLLIKHATSSDSNVEKALQVILRRLEPETALNWLKELAQNPETRRQAVIGAGILGDPILVPWLIEQMQQPALSRVAGEAFTMITGVDLLETDLKGSRPEGWTSGPNDEPDDDHITQDIDDDLPWPDAANVAGWWSSNEPAFPAGTRHLLGRTVSSENLYPVLHTGLQSQRAAAALELAVLQPDSPLFEVRAPAYRQIALLEKLTREKRQGLGETNN